MRHLLRRIFRKHFPLAFGLFAATMALFALFSFSRGQNDRLFFDDFQIEKRQTELELVEQELKDLEESRREKCVVTTEGWANNRSVTDPFPTDLFSLEQLRHGAVVLHFCGLVYMFVALAIVCDEFFVPSLSVITEVLSISDDVAGATFMAAGGSAPEFFTSLFGVFITENNVGVGTIVGSATFNILCVLACCTLFSRSTLSLTWWPLFRDILFYSVALLILTFFLLDERIHWTEAAVMFTIYLFYAIFMKFNGRIELTVKSCFFVRGANVIGHQIEPTTTGENTLGHSSAVPLEENNESAIRPASKESAATNGLPVSQRMAQTADLAADPCALFVSGQSSFSVLHAGAHYPQIYPGIVQIVLDPRNLFGLQSAASQPSRRVAFVSRISNQSLEIDGRTRKRRRLDKAKSLPSFNLEQSIGQGNGHLKVEPPNHFRAGTPFPPPLPFSPISDSFMSISPYSNSLNGAGGGLPPVNVPTKTFLKRIDTEKYNYFSPECNSKLNKAKQAESDELHKNETTTDEDGASTGHLTMASYKNPSVNGGIPSENVGRDDEDENAEETEEEKPVDLSWPKGTYKQLMFLMLAPIMFPLALTLPDVKRQDRKKYVSITFIGSVAWIAFFTYMMVWWASTIGQTLGVPTEVIGLTILAAGTSIPDLITSVIVSRKGLGDMAVSSSIGSNLFDICVGLPVPWLMHFGLRNGFISVQSNGLLCSIIILFLMLFVLVVAVSITGWRMNKMFGAIMFCAYLLFCLLSVLLEKSLLYCPLKLVSNSRKGNLC